MPPAETYKDMHTRMHTTYKPLFTLRLENFAKLGFNKPLALFCTSYTLMASTTNNEFSNIQSVLLGPAFTEILNDVIPYPTGSKAAEKFLTTAAHQISIKCQLEVHQLPHLIATTNWRIKTYKDFKDAAKGLLSWIQSFGEHNQLTYNLVFGALFNRFEVSSQDIKDAVFDLLRSISGVSSGDPVVGDDGAEAPPTPDELVKALFDSHQLDYLQHDLHFSLRNQPSRQSSSLRSDSAKRRHPSSQDGQIHTQTAAGSSARTLPAVTLQHQGSELMKLLRNYPMKLPRRLRDEFAQIDKSNPRDRIAFARENGLCYQCLAPTVHCQCPSTPSLN